MAIQKKHGKGRLDKWYKLAKEKGYRARASFKLVQLNKKYGFLEKSKVLLDLCAAPGSWCQVASEVTPVNSLIVGVDLVPIKPIPRVITFQSDITTEKCRATIRQHLKTWKADTVLHDGAPNVGTAWVQDSFNQAELVLQAMKLATEFLVEGGTFVTKVFRSKDYNSLLWVFNQLFSQVEATKPPSSRNVSAEIFVVCQGYRAPKCLDPRFLDPRAVFAEISGATPKSEAKVYNPEVKKRKREGYEEGDYTLFKETLASEFIHNTDPIAILANFNKLSFQQPPNEDTTLAALDKLSETTPEIRTCCSDLKILGRKDFKLLLRWRLRVREIFGFSTKEKAAAKSSEEHAEVEAMDEELKIQEELQAIRDRDNAKKRREKRKENYKRQKEIIRMQMHMISPMDIGMDDAGPVGEGSMFSLRSANKTGTMRRLYRGKMASVSNSKRAYKRVIDEANNDSDFEEDRLEQDLDSMYESFKERKAKADAKYRAKKAQEHKGDDEWEGISASDADEEAASTVSKEGESSSSDEDEDSVKSLLKDFELDRSNCNGLSSGAATFFDQDIFKDIIGAIPGGATARDGERFDEDDEIRNMMPALKIVREKPAKYDQKTRADAHATDEGVQIKTVKSFDVEDGWDKKEMSRPNGGLDIITAEAMTLAHQLASGKKTSQDTIDDGFNKHAFRDRHGLPDWFLDDEAKHDKPHKPISKAAAQAIKEKLRAFNARPIKKIREAKARKKIKAAQKLERLKKKSNMLAADEGMTEREKADSISKLLSKAARKKPTKPARLVVARGANKGIKGRPNGVKGRYRIVDARMKKELRAQKRVSQRKKR